MGEDRLEPGSPRLLLPARDVHPTTSKGRALCAHCTRACPGAGGRYRTPGSTLGPAALGPWEPKVTRGDAGRLQSTLPACRPSPRGRGQVSFPETPEGPRQTPTLSLLPPWRPFPSLPQSPHSVCSARLLTPAPNLTRSWGSAGVWVGLHFQAACPGQRASAPKCSK